MNILKKIINACRDLNDYYEMKGGSGVLYPISREEYDLGIARKKLEELYKK
jgi:hypothetical protein